MKTIDLTRNSNLPIMEVILDNVGTLRLKPMPKQDFARLFMSFSSLEKLSENPSPEAASNSLNLIYEACTMILNNNISGKQFSIDEVSEILPLDFAFKLIEGYIEEVTDFLAKIN